MQESNISETQLCEGKEEIIGQTGGVTGTPSYLELSTFLVF